MFNKEIMINAVVSLGFSYAGRTSDGGSKYSNGGHAVLIYDGGMVHCKPNGTNKVYYSEASTARIRAALVKSLAYYKSSADGMIVGL